MLPKNRVVNKRIGKLLVERGIITSKQLEEALTVQVEQEIHTKRRKLLGEILIELGYASEEDVINSVTTQYGVPYLPIDSYEIDEDLIKTVPPDLVEKYEFLPIDKIGDLFTIAIADIPDTETVAELEKSLKCKVEAFVCGPAALRKAIEKYYG
ncbi:MAG: hypothetical protein V1727_04200 [Candidatus Omnitrophota bacterium]